MNIEGVSQIQLKTESPEVLKILTKMNVVRGDFMRKKISKAQFDEKMSKLQGELQGAKSRGKVNFARKSDEKMKVDKTERLKKPQKLQDKKDNPEKNIELNQQILHQQAVNNRIIHGLI